MSDLPKNWAYGTLSQATDVVRGITFPASAKRSDFRQGYVCCLRTTNVQQTLEWNDVYYVPSSYVKREEQLVREGDVLMSMANSYALVGKVARAVKVLRPSAFGAFLAAVRPTLAIDGGYLYHFLRSYDVQNKLREGSSQTTNIANISVGRLSELLVPLAPLSEQKRIAGKLDTVLSRVDAVNTQLARVASVLKRFRQSVLAAAISGRLTEDWRDAGQNSSVWTKATVGAILTDLRYGTSKKCSTELVGTPVLRIPNIGSDGAPNLTDLKYAEFDESERAKLSLRIGDLLIIRSNGSVDLVGKCCVVNQQAVGMLFAGYLMRLRVDASRALPKFVHLTLLSPLLRQEIERKAKSTSGVNNINSEELRSLPIMLPPIDEQTEIVRRVETLFAFADRLKARLQSVQTASERLTPALLAKAFRGELVSQNPNDEPASELLRRLKGDVSNSKPKRGRKAVV